MKPFALIVFAVALTVASEARAEVPTVGTATPPPPAQATPPAPAPPATLELGYGMLELRENDNHVRQSRVTIAPEFAFGQRLHLAPIMRLTTTSIDLLQKDSMAFDASLSFPWQPSLGGRISYDTVDYKMLHLDVIGEFEFPLGQNRAWLSSFTPRGEIAKLDINVDSLRNHVTVDHDWRTLQLTLRLRADFGWFHPYADLGYMSTQGRLAVNFDGTASSLLQNAKLSPDRFYNTSVNSPYYMVGAKLDLGRGFQLRLSGMVLPTTSQQLYVGEGALIVPLDLPF